MAEVMQNPTNTIDPAEIAKFEAMAAEWWDLNGKFKPLHMLNPCRLDYITRQIAGEFARDLDAPLPFNGLRILDIGCGGGLLCEPMARLGATVVGVDAAPRNIPVARVHAEQSGLEIDYRVGTAEALVGVVRLVEPTIDATSRLGRVRITLDRPELVRSGMFVDATVLVVERKTSAVPVTAVGSGADGSTVMRVRDGLVERVSVTTGIRDAGMIEITSGVVPGDLIVTKAAAFVRDGDKINPVLAQVETN